MALTYAELEAITNDWDMANNGKAWDNYFNTSYFLTMFMKEQKGLWKRPSGGIHIKVPIKYDENDGGFFERADALDSDDREIVNVARFKRKHNYGNATVYWTDELDNSGEEAVVSMVTERMENAQETARKWLASNVYNAVADSSKYITGLRSTTSETAGTPYGDIEEEDLVSEDGSKVWEGKTTTTTEAISLSVMRTLVSSAKVYDGPMGKPKWGFTTETLMNVVKNILQPMQMLKENGGVTKAGFDNIVLDSTTYVADDYCPSGYLFVVNHNFLGFGIHKNAYFKRTPWQPLPDNKQGRTMKRLWSGNIICNYRAAHAAHSNLS